MLQAHEVGQQAVQTAYQAADYTREKVENMGEYGRAKAGEVVGKVNATCPHTWIACTASQVVAKTSAQILRQLCMYSRDDAEHEENTLQRFCCTACAEMGVFAHLNCLLSGPGTK